MSEHQQPEPMTVARLAEIRASLAGTTPGPWHVFKKWRLEVEDASGDQIADLGYIGDVDDLTLRVWEADSAFIAAARQDVPDLLAFAEAALPILRAVAATEGRYGYHGSDRCLFCDADTGLLVTGLEDDTLHHTDDCPVTVVRALLAGMDAHAAEDE